MRVEAKKLIGKLLQLFSLEKMTAHGRVVDWKWKKWAVWGCILKRVLIAFAGRFDIK